MIPTELEEHHTISIVRLEENKWRRSWTQRLAFRRECAVTRTRVRKQKKRRIRWNMKMEYWRTESYIHAIWHFLLLRMPLMKESRIYVIRSTHPPRLREFFCSALAWRRTCQRFETLSNEEICPGECGGWKVCVSASKATISAGQERSSKKRCNLWVENS